MQRQHKTTVLDRQDKEIEDALVRLDEAWSHLFRQIAADVREYPFAIPPEQVNLLRLLDRWGAQRMSDVAARLHISQGGCTTFIDRAVQAGLVKRERAEGDRRVVWVSLSEAGDRTLAEIRRVRARILARYLGQLKPGEIQTLAMLLSRAAEVVLTEQLNDEQVMAV